MLGCESPGLKQPWAGISERLWRYVRERCTTTRGTEDVDHCWRNVGAGPTTRGTWNLDQLLAVRSFAAEASLEVGLGGWGGAGFHSFGVVIDHTALSGLNARYFGLRFYPRGKQSAAAKHGFITLFQSPD